ncbi:hypothetical protein NDU88_000424 [Pleurodeles waltl]|uniref:Uncharacterized protein n=1 Tax=Pleurodeles waltl TaxID=8319 RepID=A0AAV7KPW4_PLEWA|nr:hypothetical protein NDU88_000424 [Pleurodeles waltl]
MSTRKRNQTRKRGLGNVLGHVHPHSTFLPVKRRAQKQAPRTSRDSAQQPPEALPPVAASVAELASASLAGSGTPASCPYLSNSSGRATQLLSSVEGLSALVIPTSPWAPADNVQNALVELKQQINAEAALHLSGVAGVGNEDIIQSSTPPLGQKFPAASEAATGNAWLVYDRDFGWTKVEDRDIGWDQTEVNVWLECVSHREAAFLAPPVGRQKRLLLGIHQEGVLSPRGTLYVQA